MSRYIYNYDDYIKSDNIDIILKTFSERQDIVADLAIKDYDTLITLFKSKDSPIIRDDMCQCMMGQGDCRTPYSCYSCKVLRRLTNIKQGLKPFSLLFGENLGKKLVVEKISIISSKLFRDIQSEKQSKIFLQQNPDLITCGTPDVSDMKCISGDSFTISTIVRYLAQDYFKMTHLQHMYTSFICRNQGYLLVEAADDNDITNIYLTNGLVYSLITQLTVSLKELTTINFSHGRPTREALNFSYTGVSYQYENKTIGGHIKLMIGKLENCSAMFHNIHYFSKDNNEYYLDRSAKIIRKDNKYKLNNSNINNFLAWRNIGLPLLIGSFDYYCFWLSLMRYKPFREVILADSELTNIWNNLWVDVESINETLVQYENENGDEFTIVCEMLKGHWLYCNVLDIIWNLIQ